VFIAEPLLFTLPSKRRSTVATDFGASTTYKVDHVGPLVFFTELWLSIRGSEDALFIATGFVAVGDHDINHPMPFVLQTELWLLTSHCKRWS